jgi:hypothetical protein
MPFDFISARQDWRELNAANDHDPEGDRLAELAEDRFLAATYSDQDEECTCRFSGDRADASDCDAHNPRSNYNHGQMALDFRMPAAAVRLVESVDDLMLDEGVA